MPGLSSWVTTDMTTCYPPMECDSRDALDRWMARWRDLADFEVVPVITSGVPGPARRLKGS